MAETANTASDDYVGLSAKQTIDAMSDDEKTALKGWYWYDWGNQAYALTVKTVIVPALMANLYNKATGTQGGAGFFALIYGLAMLVVADCTSPWRNC